MTSIHVTFFGHSSVGKSALIRQYIHRETVLDYVPTIQDCYNCDVTVDGYTVNVTVVDTTGDEEFRLLRDSEFVKSDYVVFVYSVDKAESFTNAQEDIGECLSIIAKSGCNNYPSVLIVGNKCEEDNRVVLTEDGEKLAAKIRSICPCAFFETSATHNINVKNLFETFATGITIPTTNQTNTKEHQSPKKIKKPVIFKESLEALNKQTTRRSKFIAFFSPRRRSEKR